MEVKRIAIAKPTASKPSFSSFRSFSELLAGAINTSPSHTNVCSEAVEAAIRPKIVRVKPTVNRASIVTVSSQGEASGTAPNSKLPEIKSSVVYKPLAKVVSKATVSLLASMGSPSISHQQILAHVEARAQHLNQSNLQMKNKPMSYKQTAEPPKRASEIVEEEPKPSLANVDRPSYDGYNWRKYGQKQVKGSEYPRSYYKCTHPKCPVKKKVERSFEGQIAEIVYKGEHSHPKPLPPKKSSSGAQGQQDTDNNNNNISESNEGSEGHLESHSDRVGLYPTQSTYLKRSRVLSHDLGTVGAFSIGGGAADDLGVVSAGCVEGSMGLQVEDSEPRSKRRKNGNQNNEAGTSREGISLQNANETEILGDGFRWRKYGQKVVKGNPYPRSYYKCTSLKCNVRKHVERASDDPKAFITTYEGKHNHEKPRLKITSSAASQSDS